MFSHSTIRTYKSGGKDTQKAFHTTDGQTKTDLPDLPAVTYQACLAIVDSQRLVITGGDPTKTKAYEYTTSGG